MKFELSVCDKWEEGSTFRDFLFDLYYCFFDGGERPKHIHKFTQPSLLNKHENQSIYYKMRELYFILSFSM